MDNDDTLEGLSKTNPFNQTPNNEIDISGDTAMNEE